MGFSNGLKPIRAHLELKLCLPHLAMGWETWGPIRERKPRRQPSIFAAIEHTGEQQTKTQGMTPGPPNRTFWSVHALSERKWLSTGKWGISHQSYFQPQGPAAPLTDLELQDGGGHRWPEPRACPGHLGSWRLINLGKVWAEEGWGGEVIRLFFNTKKGNRKGQLRHQEGAKQVARDKSQSPLPSGFSSVRFSHTLLAQEPQERGWVKITPLLRWRCQGPEKSDSPKGTRLG